MALTFSNSVFLTVAVLAMTSYCDQSRNSLPHPFDLPVLDKDEKVNDFFEVRENLRFTIKAIYNGNNKVSQQLGKTVIFPRNEADPPLGWLGEVGGHSQNIQISKFYPGASTGCIP